MNRRPVSLLGPGTPQQMCTKQRGSFGPRPSFGQTGEEGGEGPGRSCRGLFTDVMRKGFTWPARREGLLHAYPMSLESPRRWSQFPLIRFALLSRKGTNAGVCRAPPCHVSSACTLP